MSSFTLKTIKMDLTEKSIDRAIMEIERFKDELRSMCEGLIHKLVTDGVEIAKLTVVSMDARYTDTLLTSIKGAYFADERCGVVYTDTPYALYVEFGTGIVGEQGPFHPMQGQMGWEYDINNYREEGWWYPAPEFGWYIPKEGDGTPLAWTKGMPSRPFMYKTLRALEETAEKEGIKGFRNLVK